VAAPLLNEIVAAGVLRAVVADVTLYGLQSAFPESVRTAEFVAEQFELYALADGIFMAPEVTGATGAAEPPSLALATAARVLHGLVGLVILALCLFAVPGFVAEGGTGLDQALSVCGKLGAYYASLWLATFVVLVGFGLVGLVTLAFFAPGLLSAPGTHAVALAAYAGLHAALLTAAARLLKRPDVIQSFGLFIVIANIFFGGVLLDLTEVSPPLAPLQRLFPLYWYINLL